MASYSVHYKFSQRFRFPPADAYRWCTDYQAEDVTLMGDKGTRIVEKINEDTLILIDTVVEEGKRTAKKRLVRLFPELLFWTNTRLSSDGKYSQFIYQIVPEGDGGSRLDFTGSHVFQGKRPAPDEIASMAEGLAKQDSLAWRLLARAMEKDLAREG